LEILGLELHRAKVKLKLVGVGIISSPPCLDNDPEALR
jgi:hypothetical protein